MPTTDPPPNVPASRPQQRSSAPRIAIVGGSLTGAAAALMLLAAGFDDLALYEAVPATAPQGGGLISLEHPALEILDRLGIDQAEYVTCPSEHIEQITVANRRPTGSLRRVYPGRFTTWTLLHAALTTRLPADVVRCGARVTGLAEHHGQPELTFADGDTVTADLIVFADGRSSTGRRLLDPDRRLRYTGYVAHRGTAPAVFDAPGDFLRFEPGPGAQFNIAPVPGGADWTFYLDATPDQFTAMFGAAPARRTFALPHHVSPAARLHVNTQATRLLPPEQAATVHVTATRAAVPMMDIDPPTRMVWTVGAGHAVLLGDALAPVRPHTARGANNGIEQAAGLVTALTQHRRHHADLPGALNGWQRRHLPAVANTLRLGAVIRRPPRPRPAASRTGRSNSAGQWNGWAVFTVTRPVMAAIVARQHTTMAELMAQSIGQAAGGGRHLDEAWLDLPRHAASMSWLGDLVVIDTRVLHDDPTLVEIAAPDRRGRYRVGFGWTWDRVAATSCHTVHTVVRARSDPPTGTRRPTTPGTTSLRVRAA